MFAFVVLAIVSVLLWLVPVELKLPVQGRVVPNLKRYVFAPRDAKIIAVHVKSGQRVEKGQMLVQLQSSKLDLLQQQLEGELATAETQLNVAIASRPRLNRTSASQGPDVPVNEQVLNVRIEGLREQLSMVVDQQNQLTLLSPLAGIVNRWDLQQKLESRPVSHGEQILEIVSPDQGWGIELEIPSNEAGYVIANQNEERCRCVIRLQSKAESIFESRIDEIANVATIAETGEPIVMARATLKSSQNDSVISGATVNAWIHCGKHSLGFVWFRGIIQWARTSGWL